MASTPFDPQTRIEIVNAYRQGEHSIDIANRFGIHRLDVLDVIEQAGLPKSDKRYTGEPEVSDAVRFQAIFRYRRGWSAFRVAEDVGRSIRTVLGWVRDAGYGPRRRDVLEEQRPLAVRRYLVGESPKSIADDIGCGPSTVRKWVRAAGHETRPPNAQQYSERTRQKAVRRYLNGETARDVAADVGCSPTTIARWVEDAGHERRSGIYSQETRDAAVRRYLAGESSTDIAEDLGCTSTTVLNWVHAARD